MLTTPTPTTGYVLDDARILSKSATGELTSLAASIEKDTVRAPNQAHGGAHALTLCFLVALRRGIAWSW